MEIIIFIFWIFMAVYIFSLIGIAIVQPITALVVIFTEKRADSPYVIGFKRYLVAVAVYLLGWYWLSIQTGIELTFTLWLIYLQIIPWIFAIWHFRHLRKWNKKKRNIKAYDRMNALNKPNDKGLQLDYYPRKKIQFKHQISIRTEDNLFEREAIIKSLPLI